MADGFSPLAPEDDDGNLGALDFYAAEAHDESSGLDAFDYLQPPQGAVVSSTDLPADGDVVENEETEVVFTVTNPPGTVSVSAYVDGRVAQIRLAGRANVSESHLADEILLVADLARQKARSAQHATMLEEMRALGHDSASTRDFLARELNLPSPEEASATTAQAFAVRYAGQHD